MLRDPRGTLIVFDDLIHAVVIVARGGAQLVVDELDSPTEGVVGEGGFPRRVGAVIDVGQPIVMVPAIGVTRSPISAVGQGEIPRQVVALRLAGQRGHAIGLVVGIADGRSGPVLMADPVAQVIISIPRRVGRGSVPVLVIGIDCGEEPETKVA